ncbi:glutamate 5-kinase [Botrimarina sp.]|uniref:glutamate 5-kinase n=1 Tax=Botrimarina sp. TaxID=2795802 RepID=UPI0032EAE5E2
MPDLTRQQIAADADPLVVKVGTRCLARPDGSLDEAQVEAIAEQLVRIGAGRFRRVVLVSSGAVGAGIGRLGLAQRPTDLASLQAAAAVGQSCLIEAYNRAFERHGLSAAQLLLTADDINDRRRYLNVRNALSALFEFGAIPIVNENDTVRTEELARNVGDNDRLAAMVTNLVRAPLLVILTDVEGLYDGDPAHAQSKLIGMVAAVDGSTESVVATGTHAAGPALSKGGMGSKLQAVQIATAAGESVILANGRRPGVLVDLLAGEPIGTLFPGVGQRVGERKRWIGFAARPLGRLTLDGGAVRAVTAHGRSLLPIGVTGVTGVFDKGDLVSLLDGSGVEVARGLTNYSSADLQQILGQPTEAIPEILGRLPYSVAVHRNDMTLVRGPSES